MYQTNTAVSFPKRRVKLTRKINHLSRNASWAIITEKVKEPATCRETNKIVVVRLEEGWEVT